jgi:hypothetical protein
MIYLKGSGKQINIYGVLFKVVNNTSLPINAYKSFN